jgi:phage terminase large subunit
MFLGGTPPPNSIVKKVNWNDNPFFPDVLRQEMEHMKTRDLDKWRHVWQGELLYLSNALVFRNWQEDDLDDRIPRDARRTFGADWGFSIDPTVALEVYTWGKTLYIANEVCKVGCEIDETPALLAGNDTRTPARWANPNGHKGIHGIENGPLIADGSRPETISYLNKRGFNIRKAIKGARSIEEGVSFIQSFDIYVNPRCKNVIDELCTYSYKIDKITDEVIPELQDKNNHFMDALRYAVEAERRGSRKRSIATRVQTVRLRD